MLTNDLLRALEMSTYALFFKVATSELSICRRWYKWMNDPQPGDLVMEISTVASKDHHSRLGRLKRVEKEFVPFGEEEGSYYDTFWCLELPDGSEFRWSNCRFVRVLENWDQYKTNEHPHGDVKDQCEATP